MRSRTLKHKIHAIGYGVFIPVFFVLTGARIDLNVLRQDDAALAFILVVVIASMLAKFVSGWIGGRLVGLSSREGALIGAATIPQLSTSLAAAITGVEFGIISNELMTAIVALTVVTTFIGPFIVRL